MRHIAIAALLGSALLTAQAQEARSPSALRPFVGFGFTSGGATLLPATITPQGSTTAYKEDVSAGGGIEGRVGLSFRLSDTPVSVRASYGVHNDQVNGISNDSAWFRRYPVEVLGFYHFTDRAAVGLGVRKATRPSMRLKNATLSSSDGTQLTGVDATFGFKSSTGIVLEGEWMVTPSWGLGMRYVREHFRTNDAEQTRISADHLGIQTQWYFR